MKILNQYTISDENTGLVRKQFNILVDDPYELIEWCEENCQGEWGPKQASKISGYTTSAWTFAWFYDQQDAMLFKLSH